MKIASRRNRSRYIRAIQTMKNELQLTTNDLALTIRDPELSALIVKLQETINSLRREAEIAGQERRAIESDHKQKFKHFSESLHRLRQPLQTLILLHDTIEHSTNDERILRFIEHLGLALRSATDILSDICQTSQLESGAFGDACGARSDHAIPALSPAKQSILLVADDPIHAETLEHYLAAEGFDISVAGDLSHALELSSYGARWPDLVIADYSLPNNVNGLDVVASLQEQLDHEFGAILLVDNAQASAARLIEPLGYSCLSKPVLASDLAICVRRALTGNLAAVIRPTMEGAASNAPAVTIVDDNIEVLAATRTMLEPYGLVVQTFTSGADFFDACGPDQAGCLLVDAVMPGMNGFEVIERLNADGYTIPAIMFTGAGDIQMAVRAMKAGATDFMEKPASATDLIACIQSALKRSLGASVISSRQEAAAARFAVLTERQREIMTLFSMAHRTRVLQQN